MSMSSESLPALPVPGNTLFLARAGAELTVGAELKKGGEGVVYEARMHGHPFAVKWRWPMEGIDTVRRQIDDLISRGIPHRDFIWPIDLALSDSIPGFGYMMPLVDRSRFTSASEFVLRNDASGGVPYFRNLATISRRVVEAFEALHGGGLCYRDISLNNIMVDPLSAEIAIIDNDNVGAANDRTLIAGTRKFMAPELVRGDEGAHPSTVTDLFSLATLLFWLMMKHDPLNGMRSEAKVSWNADRRIPETTAHLETYGTEPLFVFDPYDTSNRPPPDDPSHVWWSLYPGFIRRLFVESFTDGLLASSLTGRVMEGRWRRALIRMSDSISVCRCSAAVIYDAEEPGRRCWSCGEVPPLPPRLEVPGGTVVLCQGATITSHHLNKGASRDEIVGTVEIPRNTSVHAVTLRNRSNKTWKVIPEGESTKSVEPEQRLGVRSMTIDFGAAQGRIHVR